LSLSVEVAQLGWYIHGIKENVKDYSIKIVGGAPTFGLLTIAFRRKFEWKYTR
jgi:hypothetical protein